jgi:hypothetical protein
MDNELFELAEQLSRLLKAKGRKLPQPNCAGL